MEDYNNINLLINVVCCFSEASMTVKMQSFIDSSAIVVQYIHGLFHSRELAKELRDRFGLWLLFQLQSLRVRM